MEEQTSEKSTKPRRIVKVLKLQIIKPLDGMTWKELGSLLTEVQYRVYRLANLTVSEHYLRFHKRRENPDSSLCKITIGELNRRLDEMLREECQRAGKQYLVLSQPRKTDGSTGALPDVVAGALSQYKLRALTGTKWADVMRGKTALPTFRRSMAIPIRADKSHCRRLRRAEDGSVELELMVRTQPYPKVLIGTEKLSDGARAVLNRLLDNPQNADGGYRQRVFEIKKEERTGRWFVYVTYDFIPTPAPPLDASRIVGVDLGFSCPLYLAIGHGHARLGRRAFASLGARIRSLQGRVRARRRDVQRGGACSVSMASARSGHGRARKLQATEKFQQRINHAYSTLNHQMAAAVIKFALDNGAGLIQMENLEGLQEELKGTFVGQNWRYHELQQFIEYKAKEKGIEVRRVNPCYTSRRCSECGHINEKFDRTFRDAHNNKVRGMAVRFKCPKCDFEADADYNAARNLATADIEEKIRQQCEKQGLEYCSLKEAKHS